MTDFSPVSVWSESSLHPTASPDFSESTRPAPYQEARAGRRRGQRRPAAGLAADVHELLESMARKRVPRLDAIRSRVSDLRGATDLLLVDEAMQRLHAAATALDFMAGRTDEGTENFILQGEAAVEQCASFVPVAVGFAQRHAVQGPVARLVWIDLVIESNSLQKRVRQSARWLAEMDQDLVSRRKWISSEVTVRAIEELARRGAIMHAKLQNVHRLCGHARNVHLLCEQQASERTQLCATLHDKVRPSCIELEEALRPLVHAATYRVLVPTELMAAIDARHELQVVLTQAAAQVERLRVGDQELGAQLAHMEDKAHAAA
ncbi:MAG TPA: hypothetical protein VHL79_04805 [Ramlibacter sp.]|nr:hypothetical protein [Ramlibacter sp.]